MVRNLFLVLLLICLQKCSHGKHLLRFLTFCQRDVPEDGQYDIEYDGDQLLYVDPLTFQAVPRLPEFAEQWTPDPKLAKDAFVSLGTCKYNIPRAIKGENRPPVVIVDITWTRNGHLVDQSEVSQTQYYSNSDFSFRTTSYLRFTPQENDIYSCSVDHASLQAPLTRFWEVEVHTDHQTAETSVCVCGVILGLIGVVTGLWFIMKANKSCWA
ncbi:H-2 class II histocompatibility antigen, A-U alpha chain-like isoform X2 [Toxotes jaculatrix]|uniref:H-2 class II histocompatibility antigen, A-U alpha chain-like isoform X2 n=1 Tax=Toxotes jaculatrix TaxID=941984 RepID=UPI001B3AFC48|nr:H-2 class II histocompatibility antigen, A-U alpha chain-like isoform X2 [Toxotes jaculatrix]